MWQASSGWRPLLPPRRPQHEPAPQPREKARTRADCRWSHLRSFLPGGIATVELEAPTRRAGATDQMRKAGRRPCRATASSSTSSSLLASARIRRYDSSCRQRRPRSSRERPTPLSTGFTVGSQGAMSKCGSTFAGGIRPRVSYTAPSLWSPRSDFADPRCEQTGRLGAIPLLRLSASGGKSQESVFEQLRVRVRIGRRAATEESQRLLVI